MTKQELCTAAQALLARSYTPYPHFPVGAALECSDGSVFTGCNVENAAYSPSICAERTAVAKAVSEGHRDFVRIAIAGSTEQFCPPCGVCRQVMMEFCQPEEFQIILAKGKEDYRIYKLKDLMPQGFGPGNLEER